MRPDEPNAKHLYGMLEAAQAAQRIGARSSVAELLADREVQMLLEHALQIIGEAGSQVSSAFRLAHPEIPWLSIIGLRNVIVHEYDQVDYQEIWRITIEDVPALIEALEPLVPPGNV